MKKFTSLFALLSCLCVVSAQAEDVVTVYVDASNVSGAKYWYWGTGDDPKDWSSRPSIPAPTVEIGDKHFSVLTFTPDDGNNVSVKFTNPNDDGQTDAISNLSAPNEYYYIYNGGNSYSAYVKSLGITTSDDWSVVNNFESSGNNTWIYTLDLTGNNNDISFKLRPNNCLWAGYSGDNHVNNEAWIVSEDDNTGGYNFKLKHSSLSYPKYKITASWNTNVNATNNWTISIEGLDPSYAIAGTSNSTNQNASGQDDKFFIKSWDPSIAINQMTTTDGNIFTLTRTVSEMKGDYYFKVVRNKNWGAGSYPESNKQFTIETNGLVKVTFTYNSTTNDVSFNIESSNDLTIEEGIPFSASEGFTANKAKYYRAFTYNWGTLCLPFEIKKSYEGVTFYTLQSVDLENKILTFSPLSATIAAGQPVVFKAEDNVDLDINENEVTVSTAPSAGATVDGWTLNGTFTAKNNYSPESGYWYFFSENKFWKGNQNNIPPYRAFFTTTDNLGSASQAPFRIEVSDTEGLQFVEQEDGTVKAYYDLQGHKLDGARKGLVIENGKIIMVK